ncbi:hypothetical protein T05_3398 [Trichinella murrelli]|uniref:Uncharacterized protein n=1 Tax=Trichinella murrelli TaxID=144512 RepID=A0A0V0TFQ0_9BILA|nr:hypothetical protein T05_3398 [Trichinella murrelli]
MVCTDAYKMSDVIMNGKKFDKIYEDIVENACIAHEILRKCNGFAVETICKEKQDGQDIGHICRCFTYSTVIDDNKLQYSHVDEDIMDQQEGNEQQSGTECEEEFIAVRLNDPKKKDGNQNGKIP